MEYPLLLGGETAGKLSVWQEGLYTYMEASTVRSGEFLRIWVQGGGDEAYLGLMEPCPAGMRLRRKLSRNDLKQFPAVIEQASDRQLALVQPAAVQEELAEEPMPEEETPKEQPEHTVLPESEELPEPLETPAEEEPGLLWITRADGSLAAREGNHWLLALPARLRRVPKGADLRLICGREYLVFRY